MVREQIGPGESYRKIKRAICILITGYEEIHDSPRYHNRYWFHDPDSGSLFNKLVEIHTLELPKLPEHGDETKLCAWLAFIRATKEEEFEMLAEKDLDIASAVVKLKTLSQDERLRELAISREKLEWDIASREQGAEKRGLEKGRRSASLEIARALLASGVDIEIVLKTTGLSREDVARMRQ
jgi:predicted transposase/invertase (TIGR01784 family)